MALEETLAKFIQITSNIPIDVYLSLHKRAYFGEKTYSSMCRHYITGSCIIKMLGSL